MMQSKYGGAAGVRLTQEDLKRVETAREIFLLIKTIDVVERCFSLDKISEEDHMRIIDKSLNSYDKFKKHIPNFDLDKFIAEYDLEECTWAVDRIKRGLVAEKSNERSLFVQITQKFHEMSDCVYLNMNKPVVSAFKPVLEDLVFLLKKALPYLGQSYGGIQNLERQLGILQQKNISDTLFQNEFNELQATIETEYKTFVRAIQQNMKGHSL